MATNTMPLPAYYGITNQAVTPSALTSIITAPQATLQGYNPTTAEFTATNTCTMVVHVGAIMTTAKALGALIVGSMSHTLNSPGPGAMVTFTVVVNVPKSQVVKIQLKVITDAIQPKYLAIYVINTTY